MLRDDRGILCRQCGTSYVEKARECYATPVCYACLPPPKPLPVRAIINAARDTAETKCGVVLVPCIHCGHSQLSHEVDDEDLRECRRPGCDCRQYEAQQ